MRIELAKNVIDFQKSINDEERMKEIIFEIHNVCISDSHFQNDQLLDISDELEKSLNIIKSKKFVLDEAIKAVEKIENNNKRMIFDINENREKLLGELIGDI